jgi:hypothetical protein
MRRSKSNVPAAALRWSPERAGTEFGVSHTSLRYALAKASEHPDQDGLFGTRQIVAALHGSMSQEKLATQRELRKKLQLENAITTASVVDKAGLMKGLSALADAMVHRVMAHTELPREVREDFLRDLSELPVIVEDTAARQSKLPRNSKRDGDEADDDGDEEVDDEAGVEAEEGSQPQEGQKAPKTHFRMKRASQKTRRRV